MKKPPAYNDGFVKVYRKKAENLTVNRNVTSVEDLEFVVRLAYSEVARRQQDMEFAEQMSFSLALKIKTMRPMIEKGISNQCFAVIDNTLYGIKYIDSTKTEIFLYLEKARTIKGDYSG